MSEQSRVVNGAAVVTPVTGKKQKMPIGRPFKKGRSGNPTGRPKGTKTGDIRELAKQYGPAAIEIFLRSHRTAERRLRPAFLRRSPCSIADMASLNNCSSATTPRRRSRLG